VDTIIYVHRGVQILAGAFGHSLIEEIFPFVKAVAVAPVLALAPITVAAQFVPAFCAEAKRLSAS
jgi:hypothetical protein